MTKQLPQSSADRMAKTVSKRAQVPRRKCENPARRKRLEKDPAKWLKWYLSEAFTRPFEKAHYGIIEGAVEAHETQSRFAVAAERGIGKSAVLWGMVLYLNLSGKQPFPVCVPWAASALKRAFKFWRNSLCFNERIDADYPEYTAPFKHSRGISQRLMTTTWQDDGEPTGAQLAIGEGLIVLPSNLGCIGGSTINGNIRGLNHPMQDGKILRPSLCLLDDVQDRKVAKSPTQVADVVALIDGDVAGCGKAGRDLPMLMACNCIEAGDVSDHYLSSDEWKSLRVPCVEAWPVGWESKDGQKETECQQLWKEWYRRFQNKENPKKFYKKNKEAMTEGMVLTAPGVFEGSKHPDAFYGVMLNYHRMGNDAFMAERQQQPVDPFEASGPYDLTPAVIAGKAVDIKPLSIPEGVIYIVASTDLNPSYALTTVILGFQADQSCAVLWYGLHACSIPGQQSTPERNKLLYDELSSHGKELQALPININQWVLDAGGTNFDPVLQFAPNSNRICSIPALGFTGRGTKHYKPNGRTAVKTKLKKEECHLCVDRKNNKQIQWIAWHADYWREQAQRAWLGDFGKPGACTLFAGSHLPFATQLCAEKLLGKAEVGGQLLWNWHTQPGAHDYSDAMAQGYAMAAYHGIGTGGEVKVRKTAKRKRRVRYV